MANNFKAILRYEFEFRSKPAPGFDDITRCKIVTLCEPKLAPFSSGEFLREGGRRSYFPFSFLNI